MTTNIYHIDRMDEHLRVWIDFGNNTIDEPRGVSSSETSWTMREHHGYAADYRLVCCQGITATDWESLLEKVRPLVQQIHDTGDEEWDGNNYRFCAGQEGYDLKTDLETLINEHQPTTTVEVWDGEEWIGNSAHYHKDGNSEFVRVTFDGEDISITADTTDEELTALAKSFEDCADATQVVLGAYDALDKIRDDCRENAEYCRENAEYCRENAEYCRDNDE